MTNEQWDVCQKLIDAGQIEAALPSLKNEFIISLSPEQLVCLGDLDTAVKDLASVNVPIKALISDMIKLAKNGKVKAKYNQQ